MKSNASKHVAWVTGLKAEAVARYEELHANIWPAVKERMTECHFRNFSIYKAKIKGGYYLFAHFEYTGTDFEGDMKRVSEHPETREWWKETDPCQAPLPEAMLQGKIWTELEKVYFHA
jgi:L-rhamnose mutarotase